MTNSMWPLPLIEEHQEGGLASAGLVPSFFFEASARVWPDKPTIQAIADHMDEAYGYGGFRYPFGGSIVDSRWISEYEEDEPLDPLVSIKNEGVTMHFYPYAITALVDSDGNTMVGRFD